MIISANFQPLTFNIQLPYTRFVVFFIQKQLIKFRIDNPTSSTLSSFHDQLPEDEAAEPGKIDSSSQQYKNNKPEDFLRSELYDKQDLLLKFHISEGSLQEWRSKGVLPFIRIKGKYFTEKNVEEMLRRYRVGKGEDS